MSDRVPTVRVVHPTLGYVVINASDLQKDHVLYDEREGGAFVPPSDPEPAPMQVLTPAASVEIERPPVEDISDAIDPQDYRAVHRGRGSYSIMVNGVETIERLTKDEAGRFNAMAPTEQAEYVASRAQG